MTPTERAARTYVSAWQEPDRAARAALIDRCTSDATRIVLSNALIVGRASLARAIDDFFADPRGRRAELTTPIDAQGPLFRFRAAIVDRDGTSIELVDAGEVGSDGRIATIFTFTGALPSSRVMVRA